jgi:hypothetical protein
MEDKVINIIELVAVLGTLLVIVLAWLSFLGGL